MRRRTLLAALPLLAASRAWAAAPLKVVASFSILADMTAVIGGDDIAVRTLVPVDGDAHVWEPKPDDLRAVHDAGVLVQNGLGLEGWMVRMPKAADFKGLLITAAQAVKSRSMVEDGKRITDPHAWQDPRNGVLYVRAIANGLSQALPDAATRIHTRADAYISEIEATDRYITETLAPIPTAKRVILTSHDAFGYYGARYGITLRAVQGISTEGEPSAKDIATLVKQIKREHIHAVFVENMTDPRLSAAVARESGVPLGPTVYSDALSPAGGVADTYLKMLRHNTARFAEAMALN
jgi:zinc/manganese transport system substrate-binding protein